MVAPIWPENRQLAQIAENTQRTSRFQGVGANRASSAGQVSDEPLTWDTPAQVSVTGSDTTIAAAGTGVGRVVKLYVPVAAVSGIYVNLNGAATTSHYLIEPGTSEVFPTEQAIQGIRAGGTNVTVYVMIGAVA